MVTMDRCVAVAIIIITECKLGSNFQVIGSDVDMIEGFVRMLLFDNVYIHTKPCQCGISLSRFQLSQYLIVGSVLLGNVNNVFYRAFPQIFCNRQRIDAVISQGLSNKCVIDCLPGICRQCGGIWHSYFLKSSQLNISDI